MLTSNKEKATIYGRLIQQCTTVNKYLSIDKITEDCVTYLITDIVLFKDAGYLQLGVAAYIRCGSFPALYSDNRILKSNYITT